MNAPIVHQPAGTQRLAVISTAVVRAGVLVVPEHSDQDCPRESAQDGWLIAARLDGVGKRFGHERDRDGGRTDRKRPHAAGRVAEVPDQPSAKAVDRLNTVYQVATSLRQAGITSARNVIAAAPRTGSSARATTAAARSSRIRGAARSRTFQISSDDGGS